MYYLDCEELNLLQGWTTEEENGSIAVYDPASGAMIGRVKCTNAEQVLEILRIQEDVFKSWSETKLQNRCDILTNLAKKLRNNANRLAKIITLESGKPIKEALGEVDIAAAFFDAAVREAYAQSGRVSENQAAANTTIIKNTATGPVYAITPWNFPLALVARKIAFALAAGCNVILKPSDLTPLASVALKRLALDVGMPDEVLKVVITADAEWLSEAVISCEAIRHVSFTGSISIGRLVAQKAGYHLKKSTLELGGNAPFIVTRNADLEQAARLLILSKMRNAGQTCVAASRCIIDSSVHQEFLQLVEVENNKLRYNHGLLPDSDVGPLISKRSTERYFELIDDAKAHGGNCITSGDVFSPSEQLRRHFAKLCIITNCTRDMRVVREESFCPVLAIIPVDSFDDAIIEANSTRYGLASYLCTQNIHEVFSAVNRLRFGIICVNSLQSASPNAPLGGMKDSGWGRESGAEGYTAWLEPQYIVISNARH